MYRPKKNKFFINHGTYPFDIKVFLSYSHEEVVDDLRKGGLELDSEDIENLKCTGNARTVMLTTNQTVMIFKESDSYNEFMNHVVHELFHCVEFLFERINLPHDARTSSEAWAYQMGYIMQQFMENK